MRVSAIVALVVLLTGAFCVAAESKPGQSEQEKAKVLREVALNWVRVGTAQEKRGLHSAAERSFLVAKGYQEYLTDAEHRQLNERLQKTHKLAVEREAVLEHVRTARELVRMGQPIKARAHFEKIRDSGYLTKQERELITGELKNIDEHFDEQRGEVTELYNRSIEYYRAGELEKAREGFLAVSRYGLLVAPEGHRPEDYLVQIDNILMERLSNLLPSETRPANRFLQLVPSEPAQAVGDSGTEGVEAGPARSDEAEGQEEVVDVAEPAVQEGRAAEEEVGEKRASIIRSYTRAVLTDTASKVAGYITKGEYNRAMEVVRKAEAVVRENRQLLGEALYEQYTGWLGQLTDRILSDQTGARAK